MSKLEVDKITPQSGTTLTIGDSGDTIVIDSTSVSGAKLAAPTLVGSASSAGSILFKEDTDNGTNAVTLIGPAATADVTLTLPAATDTVVGRQTTDTLTNKTINASQLVDASIATGKLADDAVTYAKMQDTSTANRVLGAASAGTISEVQIATDMIVDANVTTAKLADSSVTNSKVASTIITGQTAASTIADDDLILISDTGESAALKKMTRANFVAGIGGTNDNRWFASYNGDQTINHNTVTTVLFTNEVIDSASAFASSTFTVPSGQGGTYLVGAGFWSYDTADVINQQDLILTKDLGAGSENDIGFFSSRPVQNQTERIYNNFTLLLNLSAGETLNVRAKIQTNDSGTVLISGSGSGSRFRNFFWGYKIIT